MPPPDVVMILFPLKENTPGVHDDGAIGSPCDRRQRTGALSARFRIRIVEWVRRVLRQALSHYLSRGRLAAHFPPPDSSIGDPGVSGAAVLRNQLDLI
jgi:hypothetical protein